MPLLILCLLPVSAWALDYVSELGGADQLQRGLVFTLAGLAGMLAHYVRQWERGDLGISLWRYWFRDHPEATLGTLVGLLAASASLYASGALQGMSLIPLLSYGVTTGYACDSVFNRGAPRA